LVLIKLIIGLDYTKFIGIIIIIIILIKLGFILEWIIWLRRYRSEWKIKRIGIIINLGEIARRMGWQ
jgi:hypothetical protein